MLREITDMRRKAFLLGICRQLLFDIKRKWKSWGNVQGNKKVDESRIGMNEKKENQCWKMTKQKKQHKLQIDTISYINPFLYYKISYLSIVLNYIPFL